MDEEELTRLSETPDHLEEVTDTFEDDIDGLGLDD